MVMRHHDTPHDHVCSLDLDVEGKPWEVDGYHVFRRRLALANTLVMIRLQVASDKIGQKEEKEREAEADQVLHVIRPSLLSRRRRARRRPGPRCSLRTER